MSVRMKFSRPDRVAAPTRLAAGPDRTVSIGRSATCSASASVPSPRVIISGASIPSPPIAWATAAISDEIRGMSRALSAAVSARRGASSEEVSSLDSVTGRPLVVSISARARCSCAGLRTAKAAATAKASTLPRCRSIARMSAASSSGIAASPLWSCPPATCSIGMSGNARTRPERSAIWRSKPIRMTAIGLPWPSTTALVASVVDTATSRMRRAAVGSRAASARASASLTPSARLPRLVSALAAATTRRLSPSISTASV